MVSPFLECFFGSLGITKIGGAGETQFHAIVAGRFEQFERTQHTQLVEEIAACLVLPAVAAGQRHQHDLGALAAGLKCQHGAVFVIGMGRGLQQAGGCLQLPEGLVEAARAGILRQALKTHFNRRKLLRERNTGQQ